MTEPQPNPKDKTPHPMKEGGVKTGQPSEKKSFGDHPPNSDPGPAREGGMVEEGAPDREPRREGGMLSEG